ncbi:hypothetical protein HK099_004201 [Clydaea vesicula]|uniref:peptidylprolyl isomerase n=1 Tax=Clydaea vesicula TaxID=447962 RepID=A0AAD5U3X5_9FUNG|nr:hypothetical protein HK099_004201 [Clydaea vesicula]
MEIISSSDKESPSIHIFNGKGNSTPLYTISTLHSSPVHLIRYNDAFETVVSIDESGSIEYWEPEQNDTGNFISPPAHGKVAWEYKSDTDLYEYKKSKTVPTSLNFSPNFKKFVTFGFQDRQYRIFNFLTGKLQKKIDESLKTIQEMQQASTAAFKLDDMEFGRRLAQERELEKQRLGQSATANCIFDESGNFLLYATILGVKVFNIVTNKIVRVIGKNETQRFLHLALYQGAPKKKNMFTMAMAASENSLIKDSEKRDPTLFCTSYKKNRFFLFSKREPETAIGNSGGRDIFNEKPSREEQTVALTQLQSKKNQKFSSNSVILHTSLGDIHFKLFPEYAPKAVENFVGLTKKGYYDGVIFHRVIKSFMVQTGDPLGDGTGGESIWGHDFEDEFHKNLKHDRAYTPWLDNKHTIFGRVTQGMDVVQLIENCEKGKRDKPKKPITINSISLIE